MPPDRQRGGRNRRGTCRGAGNRGWFICIETIQEGSERFINSPRHHRRRQSDNRNGKRDVMLKMRGREGLIKFCEESAYIWNWWQKRRNRWREGDWEEFRFPCVSQPLDFTKLQAGRTHQNGIHFFVGYEKGFRGIVSNQDFFFFQTLKCNIYYFRIEQMSIDRFIQSLHMCFLMLYNCFF